MDDEDMTLRLRIDHLDTYQLPVGDGAEICVRLEGLLVGPADSLLPLMQARRTGKPVVRLEILAAPDGGRAPDGPATDDDDPLTGVLPATRGAP